MPELPPPIDITEGYEPCGDAVIDGSIRGALRIYYATLENGKRNEFKQAEIKERIKLACWGLGQNQDPLEHGKSKDLWAMRLLRQIARVVLSDDPNLSVKKEISPLNNYWGDVHERFLGGLNDFTLRQDGILVPYHLDFTADSEYSYEPMAEIHDFRIYGRAMIRGGVYIHADYLVQHESVPVSE